VTPGPAETVDLSVLSGLGPELAAAFVSLAGDIALVIGPDGVIRNVATGQADTAAAIEGWVGKQWAETATGDTRRKIEQLLQEVNGASVSRRREVNHPSPSGREIPIAYTALRLGAQGPVLAVGRDLRAVAAIQQRFIDAQHEMERDYWKLRQAQTRHRLLHQVATDAVMVLDARTLAVLQANPVAAELFGLPATRLPGAIEELLAMARGTGRAGEIRTRFVATPGGRTMTVELSATPFRSPMPRSDDSMRLLVRARVADAPADALESALYAVAITDSNGRILMANAALRALCRNIGDAQPGGRRLTDALGDPQRSVAAVLHEVRRGGLVPSARATLGGAPAGRVEVEISAALLTDDDQECIGFTLRRIEPGMAAPEPVQDLSAAIQNLADRVGHWPLPDLLRDAADLAERHVIRSALQRTGADPPAAAALLGLSTDDLEQRLLRLGMQPLGHDALPVGK
jgi:transcriptional regulator PpsR